MFASFGSGADKGAENEQVVRAYLIITIWEFVNRPTWDDALRFLERHRELLLSDPTRDLLRWLIGELREEGRAEEAAYWETHLRVLEDTRVHGLDAVRTYFGQMGLLPPRLEL